jgi:hypothetical protein
MKGIRETKKNYIVNLDEYEHRERYYYGSRGGGVFLVDKAQHPNLLKPWNSHSIKLDAMISIGLGLCPGVRRLRHGFIVY